MKQIFLNYFLIISSSYYFNSFYHAYVSTERVESAENVSGQPIAHDGDRDCAILGLQETMFRIMVSRHEIHIVAVLLQGQGRVDDKPLCAADTEIRMQKCDARHRVRE